jgi:hypothetical protein
MYDKFNLSPRRPFECGSYKKRIISCSDDYSTLQISSLSIFNFKSIDIQLKDIACVIEGTEDPYIY